MKLLLLACFVTFACAAPNELLGTIKCTYGPSYWCKNYKQALECNAVEHCRTHAWKSNDLCSECKSVVDGIHNYAANNGTQLMAFLNELCDSLGPLADQCKVIIQTYGKTIISTIEELTADSAKVCQELMLCSKTREQVQHEMMKIFLKNFISNPKIQQLKSANEDYCEDCKLVFGEIKDALENKDLQNDLITLLEKFCAELGSYSTVCKALIDQYGPIIFSQLDAMINPETICTELGLCTNSTKRVMSATLLKPAVKLPSRVFLPLAPGPVVISRPVPLVHITEPKSLKAGPECVLCEFVMSQLKSMLSNNATEAEIREALDKVCSLLPSTISAECTSFVNKYADMIIKLLLADLQPEQICTEIGLCSGNKKMIKVSLTKTVNKANDEECDICKAVIGYLESILQTNATEEEIKKALEEVCNLLPASLKTECKTLVDKYTADLVSVITRMPPYAVCKCDALVSEYADDIIKLILEGITPEEVCKEIGLCTASNGMKSFIKNKCFLGASHWCANVHNALKCQALAVCFPKKKA